MTRIKYSEELIKFMSLFGAVTKSRVKDCFFDEYGQLFFIINQGDIRRAVGKNGANITKIKSMIKRKFRVVEFNSDISQFLKNLVYPLVLKEIELKDSILEIKGLDTKTKGLLIGRNAMNIKNYENIIKRYFDIAKIKVI